MKYILIFLLISNISYGADDVVFVKKNDPSPFDGYIFTEDRTKEIRIELLEKGTLEGLNKSLTATNSYLQQNNDYKDQQIKLFMDRNDQLVKTLKEEQSTSNLERIIYFGLGVVVTGLAVYGAKQIINH